jgi:hypothetical protein
VDWGSLDEHPVTSAAVSARAPSRIRCVNMRALKPLPDAMKERGLRSP